MPGLYENGEWQSDLAALAGAWTIVLLQVHVQCVHVSAQ